LLIEQLACVDPAVTGPSAQVLHDADRTAQSLRWIVRCRVPQPIKYVLAAAEDRP
jgi:hypothetical protein